MRGLLTVECEYDYVNDRLIDWLVDSEMLACYYYE